MSGAEWVYDEKELAAIDGWHPDPVSGRPGGVAGLRKRSACGALAAAAMLGLRDVLEPPPEDEQTVEVDAPSEPEDPGAPVVVHFDSESPQATIAFVRRPND